MVSVYTPSRSLRSENQHLLCVTRAKYKHRGNRDFLHFDLNENRLSGMQPTQKSIHSLGPADILQNGATLTLFFVYKKCSRRFITVRLNH